MVCKRAALFRGRHFTDEIIVLCVRWYLRYSLSYRDVTDIMCERNLSIDPSTIWRWVQRYAPELNVRVRRELKPTNILGGPTRPMYAWLGFLPLQCAELLAWHVRRHYIRPAEHHGKPS